MNKKLRWVIGALMIALLAVGVFGVSAVYADDGDGDQPFGKRGRGPRGGMDGVALEALAEVLDMSTDELTAALKDGKKIHELAEEAGVEMEEIHETMSAVREEAIRERVAQALEDDKITQEHADWLLEGLDKGFFFNRGGFGRGGGRFQKGDGFGPPNTDS